MDNLCPQMSATAALMLMDLNLSCGLMSLSRDTWLARSMPELTINTRSPILLLPSKNYSGLEFLLAESILLGTSTITVSRLGTIRDGERAKNKYRTGINDNGSRSEECRLVARQGRHCNAVTEKRVIPTKLECRVCGRWRSFTPSRHTLPR
jgi:hypothetical protein